MFISNIYWFIYLPYFQKQKIDIYLIIWKVLFDFDVEKYINFIMWAINLYDYFQRKWSVKFNLTDEIDKMWTEKSYYNIINDLKIMIVCYRWIFSIVSLTVFWTIAKKIFVEIDFAAAVCYKQRRKHNKFESKIFKLIPFRSDVRNLKPK